VPDSTGQPTPGLLMRVGYDNMILPNAEEIPTSFSYVLWISSSLLIWGLGGGAVAWTAWMANLNVVAHAGWDRCEEHPGYGP
jgi:hypothetical protein